MPSPERQPTSFTLDEVARLAKEVALEYGEHVPMVIAEGSTGSVVGQLVDFPETHEARSRRMYQAGVALGRSGQLGRLEQLFFVSEGWMSTAGEDGTLSQDPDRVEVLFVSELKVGKRQANLVLFEMVRDEQRQLSALDRLPHLAEAGEGYVDSPLLAAFVDGFRVGRRTASN